MELGVLQKKLTAIFKKYKYAGVILLVGIVLMAIPRHSTKTENTNVTTPAITTAEETVDKQLSNVLSQIEGAGRVSVFLTVAAGEETLYQTNDDVSLGDSNSTTRKNTVTVTDAQRNQNGLIRQVNPPRYQGAIVVCQGADSPAVRLAIVDAVSKVTGLGSDRISVLKMK